MTEHQGLVERERHMEILRAWGTATPLWAAAEIERLSAALERLTEQSDETMVERVARVLLERRGFGFYTDPMEGGQDAYDITLEATDEARAVVAALRREPDGR